MTAETPQGNSGRPFAKRGVWIVIAGLIIAFILVCTLAVMFGPALHGGVRLKAASPNAKADILVGDRLIGADYVEVDWSDILPADDSSGLGIEIPWDTPPLSLTLNADDEGNQQWAAWLAEPGAQIVHAGRGNPGEVGHGDKVRFARYELLLQRPDGQLDQVFCLDSRIVTDGERLRMLIPIRVRTAAGNQWFTSADNPFGTGTAADYLVADQVWAEWEFETTQPPAAFVEPLQTRGMWRPDSP